MRTRFTTMAVALLAVGSVLGWLAGSGQLTPDAWGQYNRVGTGQAGSADGKVLPRPETPFAGKIGRTAKESTPDFPKAIEAPKDAPNVLLILTDDVGFGASSTFGGPIPTPSYDKLAKAGLRYNMFHTTALCS